MEEAQVTLHLAIDSDISSRKGCFSDLAIISEKDGVARIDFLLGDMAENENNIRCALVSRVFMSRENLVNLKSQIEQHLSSIGPSENVSDES